MIRSSPEKKFTEFSFAFFLFSHLFCLHIAHAIKPEERSIHTKKIPTVYDPWLLFWSRINIP